MITAMDEAIGDLVVALQNAGVYDDTLIAFSSDVSIITVNIIHIVACYYLLLLPTFKCVIYEFQIF